MATTRTTDKGIGLTLLFGVLTLVAAVFMYAAPSQEQTAVGFAAAMVFATVTVAVLHGYGQ